MDKLTASTLAIFLNKGYAYYTDLSGVWKMDPSVDSVDNSRSFILAGVLLLLGTSIHFAIRKIRQVKGRRSGIVL